MPVGYPGSCLFSNVRPRSYLQEENACGEDALEGFLWRCACGAEVTHLAARAGLRLAVEMDLDVREGEDGGPVGSAVRPEVAEEVGDGGRPERYVRRVASG